MADIVVTEFMDDDAIAFLSNEFDVIYDPELPSKHSQLTTLIGDCRALIVRNRTKVSSKLLSAAPLLKVVGRLGVGLDNIELESCRARGIAIVPAIGANETTVAEYVIGAIMILLRRGTFHRTADVLAGRWPHLQSKAIDARGRTLGLIGFGRIAREVAKLAIPLGMRVVAYSRSIGKDSGIWKESGVEAVGFDFMLAQSDIVSVHVARTSETYHLVNAAAFDKMKVNSYLINTARGGIVDEAALASTLRSGKLAGAVLDVFEQEPLPARSEFHDVPNLILTPHVAGYSDEANWRQGQIVADGVRKVLQESEARS